MNKTKYTMFREVKAYLSFKRYVMTNWRKLRTIKINMQQKNEELL